MNALNSERKGSFHRLLGKFFLLRSLNLILCSILCVELFHVTLHILNWGIAAILVYSMEFADMPPYEAIEAFYAELVLKENDKWTTGDVFTSPLASQK